MLGSSAELRDIPERVGYDKILLGVETTAGESFTIERATAGGQYRVYNGAHKSTPEKESPLILNEKHNPTSNNNLSMFLLEKIGLAGSRIRKNAAGDTNSLSIRNLSHISIIAEDKIQKQGSPFETGQYTTRTAELSLFKLILTGVDDSAIQPLEKDRSEKLSKTAKLEVIDELSSEYREKLATLIGEENDIEIIEEQFNNLNDTLQLENKSLQSSENIYRDFLRKRNDLTRNSERILQRRDEIKELLSRFDLLKQHYDSDIERLSGIREAGILIAALEKK